MRQQKTIHGSCHAIYIAIISIILMLLPPGIAMAVVEAPQNIYVGDYANVLTEETEQYIITENQKLCEATGAQIVVVTVDFLDGMEIEDYVYTIFNEWGIGDKEQNNGLLLLLAIGEENYYAMQGSGLEGVLSSGTMGDYLYDYLETDFAAGNYDAGVYKVFNAFLGWFDAYYDRSGNPVGPVVTLHEKQDDDTLFWLIVILFVIILILLLSMHNRRKDQENKKNNRRGGGDGGYSDMNDMGDYRRSTRKTVYVPTGRRTGSFGGGFGGPSGGFGGGFRGGFGGGSSRGGGAGRR